MQEEDDEEECGAEERGVGKRRHAVGGSEKEWTTSR